MSSEIPDFANGAVPVLDGSTQSVYFKFTSACTEGRFGDVFDAAFGRAVPKNCIHSSLGASLI